MAELDRLRTQNRDLGDRVRWMNGIYVCVFVRDGIPSDADYNSTRVGVVDVVVVVVVRISTMG